MDGCTVPSSMDITEIMNRAHIGRLLSDNYTMLIIFIIITVSLTFVLTYFIKDIRQTIKEHNKNILKSEVSKNDQDEVYFDDGGAETEFIDPTKYQEAGKIKFFKDVDQTYKDYNLEKTIYIKSGFNKENDDYIDTRMSYKKYDDYVYQQNDV